MKEPQIQIVEESIDANRGGLVTGIVFFDFGVFQFPEPTWNDSIVVIMGWWLSALISLLKENADQAEFRFMEGPLWISMQRETAEKYTMRCVDGSDTDVRYECENISALAVLKSALIAAICVRKICDQRGWRSKDIEVLEEKIELARTLINLH